MCYSLKSNAGMTRVSTEKDQIWKRKMSVSERERCNMLKCTQWMSGRLWCIPGDTHSRKLFGNWLELRCREQTMERSLVMREGYMMWLRTASTLSWRSSLTDFYWSILCVAYLLHDDPQLLKGDHLQHQKLSNKRASESDSDIHIIISKILSNPERNKTIKISLGKGECTHVQLISKLMYFAVHNARAWKVNALKFAADRLLCFWNGNTNALNREMQLI